MKSFLMLIIPVVILLSLVVYAHYRGRGETRVRNRILFGVLVAPLVAVIVVVLVGCSRVHVYAGLEQSNNISPQCEDEGISNRLTSNLGIEGCREVSSDGRTELCGVYRHHSCAVSPDRESYDAVGFTVKRTIWSK